MRVALGRSTIKKITARSGLTNPLHTRKDRSDMSIYSSRHAARAVICIGVTAYGVCLLLLRYIALNPDPSGRSMLTALIHLLRRWGFRSGKMSDLRRCVQVTADRVCLQLVIIPEVRQWVKANSQTQINSPFLKRRLPSYDGIICQFFLPCGSCHTV